VDNVGEALDVGERHGLVVKSGAWFAFYGEKFQGRIKAIEWLRENPDALEKLKGEISERIQ
jgi:recombination protein RecA